MSTTGKNMFATPANVVTILRICLVPVYVVLLLCPWSEWLGLSALDPSDTRIVAALAFIIIACTDFIDGYLARHRDEVTDFGKFADPLADKILVAAALISLVELDTLPAWVALVVLAREFIISGVRMIAATKGQVIAASYLGKFKTAFQMTGIVLFTIQGSKLVASFGRDFEQGLYVFSWIVMGIAVVLTIWSLIDYVYKARHLFVGARDPLDVGSLTDACNEKAAAVIGKAVQKNVTVSTAESLTGGLISGALTAVSGSSAVVRGGVVSYAIEVKHDLLGVSGELLEREGAVDGTVALQMAQGSRAATKSDLAVAVTGIAGPTGAEPGKPVGTVYLGIAGDQCARSELRTFSGNREQVRLQTVAAALDLLEAEIDKL